MADKYGVREHTRLNHKCIQATWNESRAKWTVRLQRLDVDPPVIIEDESDVLITGTGLLNEWKWPSIRGLQNFTGEILHTANWQDNFTANVSDREISRDGMLTICKGQESCRHRCGEQWHPGCPSPGEQG